MREQRKTWMAGPSPAMTMGTESRFLVSPTVSSRRHLGPLVHLSAAGTSRQSADESSCQPEAQRCDGVRHVALCPQRQHLWIGNQRERQIACGIRLRHRLRGESLPFGDQEAIGRDAETGMVMKASPAAALEVAQSDLLLEFE